MESTIDQLIKRLDALEAEVAELRSKVRNTIPAASLLSIHEKARIIREAHASGDRARIRRMSKQINGIL